MDAWDVAALSRASGSSDVVPLDEQSDAYDALVSAALEADGCALTLTLTLTLTLALALALPLALPLPLVLVLTVTVTLTVPLTRCAPELATYEIGDASIHRTSCFHRTGPNLGGTPRVILGVTYFADGAVARCDVNFATLTRGQRSMVIVPPWQCSSSAPAPPQGAPGGSGQLGTPRKRPARWVPSHRLGCSS